MKRLILAVSVLALASCGDSSDNSLPVQPTKYMAVVATDDYNSSQVEFIDADGDLYKHLGNAFQDDTDIKISSYKDHFYRVHRYQQDTVAKVSALQPDVKVWQYSTLDEGSVSTANPYELIFIDEKEAFLIRYESPMLWKVNLNAVTEAEFKTAEIDLSAYIPEGGSFPHMSAGLILDGKLFLTMQRLNKDWEPGNTGYVAVIDIDTLEEIDTGSEGDLKGIPLLCKNPEGIHYHEHTGILVSCLGSYSNLANAGGVDVIDPEAYKVSSLIVEKSADTKVSSIAIVNGDLAFYVTYEGYGAANALYAFNPQTGDKIQDDPVAGLVETGIDVLTVGPDGHLWAGDFSHSHPGIHIIDVGDLGKVRAFIPTLLPPTDIAFVAMPKPEAQINSQAGF